MNLDEAIRHCQEVAEEQDKLCKRYDDASRYTKSHSKDIVSANAKNASNFECAKEHRQLAEWLKELRVFKSRKGQWLRMSDLSEREDDRYKCSHCGNVVHYKDKMDLYTFNSWCGRCGSDNGKNIEVTV